MPEVSFPWSKHWWLCLAESCSPALSLIALGIPLGPSGKQLLGCRLFHLGFVTSGVPTPFFLAGAEYRGIMKENARVEHGQLQGAGSEVAISVSCLAMIGKSLHVE